MDERKTELKALIQQRQTLEAQYTPDHPDVVEVIAQDCRSAGGDRACAAQSRRPAPAAPSVNRPDPPQLQQLKAQLRAAQQAMVDAKAGTGSD